ncbi:MAG: hypothetical protein ACYDB3_05450, partial [Acidimicrobiales bacterium]
MASPTSGSCPQTDDAEVHDCSTIGATGIAQITECWSQLREEAGERQVAVRNGFALLAWRGVEASRRRGVEASRRRGVEASRRRPGRLRLWRTLEP